MQINWKTSWTGENVSKTVVLQQDHVERNGRSGKNVGLYKGDLVKVWKKLFFVAPTVLKFVNNFLKINYKLIKRI